MDVRYFGFNLFTDSKALNLNNFFESIEEEKYVSHLTSDNEVRLYVDTKSDPKFYKGIVVTVKDQKRFCKFSNKNSSLQISVENLKGDDKLLDFNFFIVDKITGLGIYQHYYHSCAVNVFGQNIKSYFRRAKHSKIEVDLAVAEGIKGSDLTKDEAAKIRRKYSDRLNFAPLYKKENIEELLKACKSINSFEYEYSYITKDIRNATPLSKFVERKVEKLVFTKNNSVKDMAKSISAFVKNIQPKRGKVYVEDLEGATFPMNIFDMPDCFGTVNYDSLVLKLDGLEINKFSEHSFFNELTDIFSLEEYEHIFGMELA